MGSTEGDMGGVLRRLAGYRWFVREKARNGVLRFRRDRDLHTLVTFRAAVDAVVPNTPELGDELGPEHIPGGVDIDLAEYLVTYVDNGFQLGLPHVGPAGNAPLAKPVAKVLDKAALKLLLRGTNEAAPSGDLPSALVDSTDPSRAQVAGAAGPFARLSRMDRLRAINILDEIEPEFTLPKGTVFEFSGGLIGQLVVGFTTFIYYSEWEGYDDFDLPPSERTHPNDPEAVQSWRQTGFPGFANGYPALRGYVGTDEGSLGAGESWITIDESADSQVRIFREPGEFRENDYDTSGYEEPYPE